MTGKRRRVSRYIEGARSVAEVELSRLRVAENEKRLPTGGTSARSVRAALDLYLDAADTGLIELAPRTILTTRSAANTMCAITLLGGRQFGQLKLNRLSWQEIEEMYTVMRTNGSGTDWVRRCATVLSRALEFSRKRGLIDGNPTKDATRPRSTRSKPHSPTADEVRATLKRVRGQDPEFADAVTVLASTGMRKAELLGLQWDDVDISSGEVHISAAITDAGPGKKIQRKATKRSDWRDVPLTSNALAAMRAQRDLGAARGQLVFATAPFVGAIVAWTVFTDPVTTREVVSLVIAAVGVSFVLRSDHVHDHAHDPIEHDHEHVREDGHHDHSHPDGEVVRHQHAHSHEALAHAHPHVPDLHHRHDHASA